MKKAEIKIENINSKPFRLSPEGIERYRKILNELKEKYSICRQQCRELQIDIEEVEEIILNAGRTQDMLDRWSKETLSY